MHVVGGICDLCAMVIRKWIIIMEKSDGGCVLTAVCRSKGVGLTPINCWMNKRPKTSLI